MDAKSNSKVHVHLRRCSRIFTRKLSSNKDTSSGVSQKSSRSCKVWPTAHVPVKGWSTCSPWCWTFGFSIELPLALTLVWVFLSLSFEVNIDTSCYCSLGLGKTCCSKYSDASALCVRYFTIQFMKSGLGLVIDVLHCLFISILWASSIPTECHDRPRILTTNAPYSNISKTDFCSLTRSEMWLKISFWYVWWSKPVNIIVPCFYAAHSWSASLCST